MNTVIGRAAAIFSSQVNAPLHLRAALFHSTAVLDRRGPDFTQSSRRRKYYARKGRRQQREALRCNAGSYAEHLYKKLEREFDKNDPSLNEDSPRFRRRQARGQRNGNTSNQGSQPRGRRGYQFTEDDSDFETIFHHTFGGSRHFFWSFIQDEDPHWRSSSRYSNNHKRSSNRRYQFAEDFESDSSNDFRRSSNWRYYFEEDFEPDSSTEHEISKTDRVALGLSPSGPLKIKDVKDAYRACALKWHPDRHQGSSKTVAEEKFKQCSAAYQSLCEKLAA